MAEQDFDDLFSDILVTDSTLSPFLLHIAEQMPEGVFQIHTENGAVVPKTQPVINDPGTEVAEISARIKEKQTLIGIRLNEQNFLYGLVIPQLEATLLFKLPGVGEDISATSWGTKYLQTNVELALLKINRISDQAEIKQYAKQVEVLKKKHDEQLEENYRNYQLIQERELALLTANEQLKEVSRLKSEFLANMSHEIRTPLNGIIGMAEISLGGELEVDQKAIFQTIQKEADSLLNIVNTILDFSKLEAGKLELEDIPFNLRVLLEDLAQSFIFRAEQKGLCFCAYLSPDVYPHLIGDPGRIRQILVNLAGNALKFTSAGEVCIKGEVVAERENNIQIRFLINDTGIGIPKDKQEQIFEGFTQVDGSMTRRFGGTGLGTTISKKLVELMGGKIGVESEIGAGSTFWFTITMQKQQGLSSTPYAQTVKLTDTRVLVVDDGDSSRLMLTEHLQAWGCKTVECAGWQTVPALREDSILASPDYDLILIDIHLPGLSGLDVAKEIKSLSHLQKTPLIVFTTAGSRGDGKLCREIGVEGYLVKPIKIGDLRMSIESVLGLAEHSNTDQSAKLVTRHTVAESRRKEIQLLLVEDYPTNQKVAMNHLQKAGFQVDLAENGLQAFEAFKRKQYDIILMDIQMPVMDGYAATDNIRKHETKIQQIQLKTDTPGHESGPSSPAKKPPTKRIPIIAMTAHAIKGYREKCLEAGMDDYITKPLKRTSFLAIVDKWISPDSELDQPQKALPLETESNADGQPATPQQNVEAAATDRPENGILDLDRAIEEFEGDRDFLFEIIEGFKDNVTKQLAILEQAITAGDAETVRREAHSIKGGAANLTAEKLRAVAFELENIGHSGELGEAGEALARLTEEFQKLVDFVNTLN